MRIILLLSFTFTLTTLEAQVDWGIEMKSGPGITAGLVIHPSTDKVPIYVVSHGATFLSYQFPNLRNLEVSVGLGAKHTYTQTQIGNSIFSMNTWRAIAPISLSARLKEKLYVRLGITSQNNRDFNDIFIGQPFNFRFDATSGLTYHFSEALRFTANYQRCLIPDTDGYFLNDPKNSWSVGFILYPSFKTKP